jgi:hypothetical protein
MDWKAFIASVLSSIAWPSVLIILIILLRRQLVGLAERLQELSLPGGAKATFERQLETARIEAERLPPVPDQERAERVVPETEESRFLRVAATSPEFAIVEVYKRIDAILDKLAKHLEMKMPFNNDLVIHELVDRSLLDKAALELYNTLRNARNVAAHVAPGRISTKEALDYRSHTISLLARLHTALGRLEGQARNPLKPS